MSEYIITDEQIAEIWHYNDSVESAGTWIFIPASVNGKVVRYGKR